MIIKGARQRWARVVVLVVAMVWAILSLPSPTVFAQVANWTMFQHDGQRQGANTDPADPLTPATAGGLERAWTVNLNAVILSEPIVVGEVVYVGASDGYFYSLDRRTGAQNWRVYLGQGPMRGCDPAQVGVGSTALYAQLSGGAKVVFVAGVDSLHPPEQADAVYLYALNADTGAPLWRQPVGNPQQGAYTWASPFLANNRLYYGVGSQGDPGSPGLGSAGCPLARGTLYAFDPATGNPMAGPRTFVDPQALGGGIYTTPAVDEASGTIYLTTGNPGNLPAGQDYRNAAEANALLALDWTTLATKARYQLPGPTNNSYDFSSGPILFSGSRPNGPRRLVGVGARNNSFYAFDADTPANIAQGPVWIQQIGDRRGKNAKSGEGAISAAAFVNGILYVGGGDRCFNTAGRGCTERLYGTVVALDPSSGRVHWRRRTGRVGGALTGSNKGLLFVPVAANTEATPAIPNRLEVLDARDGAVLAQFTATDLLWSGAAVSQGMVFYGSYDKNLYALQLNPERIGDPDPSAPPTGLRAQPGYNAIRLDWVSRSPNVVRFRVERKRYHEGITWETLAVSTGTTFTDYTAENGTLYEYQVIAEYTDGSESAPTNTVVAAATAGLSADWASLDVNTEWAGSSDQFDDTLQVTAGGGDIFGAADQFRYVFRPQIYRGNVEITARLLDVLATGTYTKAGVDIRAAASNAAVGSTPSAVDSTDAGAPHLGMFYLPSPGTALETNYRTDYYGGTNFAGHIPTSAPVWLRVRQRGRVMEGFYSADGKNWVRIGGRIDYGDRLRNGVTVGVSVTAHDESQLTQARFDSLSINTQVPPQPPFNFKSNPMDAGVELTWDPIPGATSINIYREANRSGKYELIVTLPGTAVRYVDNTAAAHVPYFYRISSLNDNCDGPCEEFADNEVYGRRLNPTELYGFTSKEIGSVAVRGDADFDAGGSDVLIVYTSGSDIWDTSDSFRFTYKPMCGDGEVRAQVLYLDPVNDYSKAGVMIRESDAPNARNFALFWTPAHQFHVQWRANTGGGSSDFGPDIPGELGSFVRVVRTGNVFKAYLSPDGETWTQVGPPNGITIPMGSGALQGVAVTSHNNGVGALAQFNFVETISDVPDPNDPPRSVGQLQVPGGIEQIEITWGPACNADHYQIYRGVQGQPLTLYRDNVRALSFTDTNVTLGTVYCYQVRGVSPTGTLGELSTVECGRAIRYLDHSAGFGVHSDLKENGSAGFPGNVARLTNGGGGQAGTIFSTRKVRVNNFQTTFRFQITGGSNPRADGMVFIIQNNNPNEVGPAGGGLAYGSDNPTGGQGIRNSVAIKFDIYDNAGEGTNSTGIFTDGRSPTVRRDGLDPSIPDISVPMPQSVVDLHNGQPKRVTLTYNGTTLTEEIYDEGTRQTFTRTYTVDIARFIGGGNMAYVGFGGGTGGLTAVQDVLTWTYDER